ncbi:MAG TPA: methylated-DNA--[protein]-cysteine S-methyltransferase [Acidimicrobiia bacterium]|nr:methylated-DNA--[protein]-cysteine S-methyltransferase [Acidimicrobiia bacterium]
MRAWLQPSPIGSLAVAVDGEAVVRIDLSGDLGRLLAAAPDPHAVEILERAPTRGVAKELDGYFAGRLRTFTVPVDLSSVGGFHREALQAVYDEVGYGDVASYGEVAAMAGRPLAARAVGQAMNRNPVPVIVGCHRVLAADGSLHGFGTGGLETKRRLLEIEGVVPTRLNLPAAG